jgi:hypothetical protein
MQRVGYDSGLIACAVFYFSYFYFLQWRRAYLQATLILIVKYCAGNKQRN